MSPKAQRNKKVKMIEDSTLDITDRAEELNMYAIRDLRLGPSTDSSSLDGKISMSNRQVHFADIDENQAEYDQEQTTKEQMYYTQQIASSFEA